jgi:hypothetical protein
MVLQEKKWLYLNPKFVHTGPNTPHLMQDYKNLSGVSSSRNCLCQQYYPESVYMFLLFAIGKGGADQCKNLH